MCVSYNGEQLYWPLYARTIDEYITVHVIGYMQYVQLIKINKQ